MTRADAGGLPAGARVVIVGASLAGLRAADKEKSGPDLGSNTSLHGYRPLPDDNAWNTPVDKLPVDAKSTV